MAWQSSLPFDTAKTDAEPTLAKKNILTHGKKIKADEAARSGKLEEAKALYQAVCKTDGTDVEAWVKLGVIEKQLGRFQEAETCCRRGIAINPGLGLAHYGLGSALHSQGKIQDAIGAYRKAIQLQPDLADAHYLLGNALHATGQVSEALSCYKTAIGLKPRFPEALGDMGAALIDRGDSAASIDVLKQALQFQPGNVVALSNLSLALRLQGKVNEALEGYRHALRLAPDSAEVMAHLAGLLEKTGELTQARELAKQCLIHAPSNPMAGLVLAQLDRRAKRFDQAVDRLQALRGHAALPVDLAGDIELALGQLYDQLHKPEDAYPLIAAGNQKKAKLLGEDSPGQQYLQRIASISALVTPQLVSAKHNQARDLSPADPIFLIGFPRSGTTLLEQMLDSHPALQAMEEKGAVAAMVNTFLESAGDNPDALAELNDGQIQQLRQCYFDEAKKHLTLRPDAILVDKMPLNTVNIPVIWRVFPKAKFILAIRHPCDASLSCLMQNFAVNAAMANFFTLEDTANVYAAVMGAWQKYVTLLPLDYHRIRYEDLVEDVEAETRRLMLFLGLPWDDAILQHTEHAKKRGAINTPSYHQVVQPIYQNAKYRWKRYAKEFAGVLPTLQPFIDYFGYSSDTPAD